MKKRTFLLSIVAGMALFAMVAPSFAADSGKEERERTITGEAKCAKCTLKESDKCQTVIETKSASGRVVKYYVVGNDLAKKFHDNICESPKKVTAVGTVKRVDGKRELTVTKIELAKDKEGEK